MLEHQRFCYDGAQATGPQEFEEGNQQVDGEDEEFAHGANRTRTASVRKTALHGRIPSYCEFATDSIYPAVYSTLPYDPVKDFIGVGMTSTNAVLAVLHPSVPASTLQEFVAYAKANPGKVAAGVASSGSLLYLATELLKTQAGIDLLVVPYKGSGPAVTDLLGGQVQLLIDAPPVMMQHVKAGKLKAIAVSGKSRLAALPDVPTFEEAGVSIDASGWQGIAVPTGTPPAAVARLSEALAKVLAQQDVRDRFAAEGLIAAPSTAEAFTAHIRSEVPKWTRVAKAANIKVE